MPLSSASYSGECVVAMQTAAAHNGVQQFQSPKQSLGDLDAEVAAKLIAAAADIALVVDRSGVICDIATGSEDLSQEGFAVWLGQPWIDTVTGESREKIEDMLNEATAKPVSRSRQVNHPSAQGSDVPIRYVALRVGDDGRIVAVGRDLRALSALQQRLVNVQQMMEREYARLRHAETRYRLLFQLASEAVVIVDAATQKIVEANPAAQRLIGAAEDKEGGTFLDLFDPDAHPAIQAQLAIVRTAGRADDVQVRLANGRECTFSASLFRQERASHFLVRLTAAGASAPEEDASTSKAPLTRVIENIPDGFVVTGADLRILTVNSAFLDLAQLATGEQVRGEPLDRWIGRPGVDLKVLLANLKEHGAVRHFGTIIRGEYGSTEGVEISAVSVPNGSTQCIGFVIRGIGRRSIIESHVQRDLPHSVEQLTGLVGRVSLKDIVRETTDVIERLCIEAALELTGDNRTSAAPMLGLSRQSLYAKLRRYGLGDGPPEDDR